MLLRQDTFDKTVSAKRMKTKDSKEAVKVLNELVTNKKSTENLWVDQGTEFTGDFKNFFLTIQ